MTSQVNHQQQLSGNDDYWMRKAIALAKMAYNVQEVPVGAVIVDDNDNCIGVGFNQPIMSSDPTAHAEVVAIRQATSFVGNYRLPGATLYVTLEPCIMCMGAIVHTRFKRVVFAAPEPKTGVLGSCINALDLPFLNHFPQVCKGPCERESSYLLKKFFQESRR